jgi:hypothetical protein
MSYNQKEQPSEIPKPMQQLKEFINILGTSFAHLIFKSLKTWTRTIHSCEFFHQQCLLSEQLLHTTLQATQYNWLLEEM